MDLGLFALTFLKELPRLDLSFKNFAYTLTCPFNPLEQIGLADHKDPVIPGAISSRYKSQYAIAYQLRRNPNPTVCALGYLFFSYIV